MIEGESFLILLSSVSDPLNFDVDPDPLPGIVYLNLNKLEALKHWVGYVTSFWVK